MCIQAASMKLSCFCDCNLGCQEVRDLFGDSQAAEHGPHHLLRHCHHRCGLHLHSFPPAHSMCGISLNADRGKDMFLYCSPSPRLPDLQLPFILLQQTVLRNALAQGNSQEACWVSAKFEAGCLCNNFLQAYLFF